jgi:DNA-binding transcriptional MerR regulator
MENSNLHSLNVMLTIDQVSELSGVKKNTLRYWEKKFGEFLNPLRSKTRHRKYSFKDLEIIVTIKHLLEKDNLTYKGVLLRLATNYSKASNN